MATFVARQVVSSMENEKQSQNLLLKVDQRFTFRNTFLQPATNVFVAGQVDYRRKVRKGKHRQKLGMKQRCATS